MELSYYLDGDWQASFILNSIVHIVGVTCVDRFIFFEGVLLKHGQMKSIIFH